MPKFVAALRDEMRRVARKESKSQVIAARKAAAQHRRSIAALKRLVANLARRVAYLEMQEKRRATSKPVAEQSDEVRFSPRWVKAHRNKLGLSALDYGKLIGVSGLTVYNWESGKSRPRESLLPALSAVRSLRKREALHRLEMLAG
jgi:DNA-binding transcriptional regulator YiaG